VSRFTLNQAGPHLVKLFLDPDEVQNRAPILRLLADLIDAARQSDSKGDGSAALAPYKDEVLGVLTVGLKNPASSIHALDGLKGMVLTSNLLSDDEQGFVVHNVNELFEGNVSELSEDVRYALFGINHAAYSHKLY
jgi:DNA repair/transcription protein MET18/MMS19